MARVGEGFGEYYGVVSLEEAKKLKAEGYNKPCECFYVDKDDIPYVKRGLYMVSLNDRRLNHNRFDDFIISAPYRHEARMELGGLPNRGQKD